MNIPPDDQNNPPGGFPPGGLPPDGGGLGFDPSATLPADISLTSKGGSKLPYIIIGALLVGGGGFFAWSSKKAREDRVTHVKFMEEFRAYEKDDLIKFWSCFLGPNSDGTVINDPNVITAKVDIMFASDFRAYPTRVREECAQKAKDAQGKIANLGALPVYTAALEAYGKGIVGISEALDDWAKVAPEQVQAKMVGKNVGDYGTAWHAFAGGALTPEVIGYDQFLHCAIPTVDTMKDTQAFVEALHNQCKDAAYREKLQADCGKLVTTDKPAAPTKGYKGVLAKMAADDRELQGFDDCLKRARKGKLKDNLAPVGLKWVAFREAREALLKIGAEALKE